MHAIERPHFPRIGVLAVGAVLLAIMLLLIPAARVGDIGLNSGPASAGAPATPPAKVHDVLSPASSWAMNPFSSPFHVVLRWVPPTER